MEKQTKTFLAMLTLASACVLLNLAVPKVFSYPYPAQKISSTGSFAAAGMAGAIMGARRLAADIAWIELLQYYGSPEEPLDKDVEFKLSWDMTRYLLGVPVEKDVCYEKGCGKEGHYHPDFNGGVYSDIYKYSLSVVALDPFFSYAYLYSAGALAWNLNRPDEAMKLLEAGISATEKFSPEITKDAHQPFWQYHLYMSAIIYSKSGKFGQMTELLETAVKQPGCPNMVKAILANIYQKNSEPAKSMRLWFEIYDSKDPTYSEKAARKITELKGLTGV